MLVLFGCMLSMLETKARSYKRSMFWHHEDAHASEHTKEHKASPLSSVPQALLTLRKWAAWSILKGVHCTTWMPASYKLTSILGGIALKKDEASLDGHFRFVHTVWESITKKKDTGSSAGEVYLMLMQWLADSPPIVLVITGIHCWDLTKLEKGDYTPEEHSTEHCNFSIYDMVFPILGRRTKPSTKQWVTVTISMITYIPVTKWKWWSGNYHLWSVGLIPRESPRAVCLVPAKAVWMTGHIISFPVNGNIPANVLTMVITDWQGVSSHHHRRHF